MVLGSPRGNAWRNSYIVCLVGDSPSDRPRDSPFNSSIVTNSYSARHGGGYPRGSVLPDKAAEDDRDLEELARRSCLTEGMTPS